MPACPLGYRKPAQMFTPANLVGTKQLTQMVIIPDRPLLVSMSAREVEFSGFPYVEQEYRISYPRMRDSTPIRPDRLAEIPGVCAVG